MSKPTQDEAATVVRYVIARLDVLIEQTGKASKSSAFTLDLKIQNQREIKELQRIRDQYRRDYYQHIERLTGTEGEL